MTEEASQARRRAKERSPSYPGIPLGDAIERARLLYERERRHPVPVDAVLSAWGQKPKSGAGLVALAALRKFGLLESEGLGAARRIRLSDEALAIILDDRSDSLERSRRIKTAALRPTIHAELWEKYGGDGLPSDETLRHELVYGRGFTESGARELIQQFRATVDFAKLAEPDKIPEAQPSHYREHVGVVSQVRTAGFDAVLAGGSAHPSDDSPSPMQASQPHPLGDSVRMTFPLAVDMDTSLWPVLQVPIPMTEEAWEQMLSAINILKVGVVRKTATTNGPPSAQPPAAASE